MEAKYLKITIHDNDFTSYSDNFWDVSCSEGLEDVVFDEYHNNVDLMTKGYKHK